MKRMIGIALLICIMAAGIAVSDPQPDMFGCYNWIGTSTDTKTDLGDVDSGSTFFETDTGNIYIYDGSDWSIVTPTKDYAQTVLESAARVAISAVGFDRAVAVMKVADVDSTITYAWQGKIGDSEWFNLTRNSSTSIEWDTRYVSAAGTYVEGITGTAVLDSLAFTWVSGTANGDTVWVDLRQYSGVEKWR